MGGRLFLVWLAIVVSAAHAYAQPCPYGEDQFGDCLNEPLPTVSGAAATGTRLLSNPSGAVVYRCEEVLQGVCVKRGEKLGETPTQVSLRKLPRGRHWLVFEKKNYEHALVKVDVSGPLKRVGPLQLQIMSSVIFESNQDAVGASMFLDGAWLGTYPLKEAEFLADGRHYLEVKRASFSAWKETIVVTRGSGVRTIKFVLEPAFGFLSVGPSYLQGVNLFLDPPSDAQPCRVERRQPLGQTPLIKRPVRIGRHELEICPDGLPGIRVPIEILDRRELRVPYNGPEATSYESWGSIQIEHAKAQRDCDDGRSSGGCLVAAHGVLRKHRDHIQAINKGLAYYRKGCVLGGAEACFAAGYLARQQKMPDAGDLLARACKAGVVDACWTRHVPLDRVTDPTMNPGPWTDYVKEDHGLIGKGESSSITAVGVVTGFGPYDGYPAYLELDGHGAILFGDHGALDLALGIRSRVMAQVRDGSDDRSFKTHVGLGVDLGYRRFTHGRRTWVRANVRITGYFPNRGGLAPLLAVGFRRGRRYVEIGAVVEKLPLRWEPVAGVNGSFALEHEFWRPVVLLTLGHVWFQ